MWGCRAVLGPGERQQIAPYPSRLAVRASKQQTRCCLCRSSPCQLEWEISAVFHDVHVLMYWQRRGSALCMAQHLGAAVHVCMWSVHVWCVFGMWGSTCAFILNLGCTGGLMERTCMRGSRCFGPFAEAAWHVMVSCSACSAQPSHVNAASADPLHVLLLY